MEYMIDLHTHTIASGHGYSTLKENIDYAKQKGIKVLGMSEHATALPGGPHPYFLQNYKCIPREHDGLQLLCGVEANIIDFDGTLDVDAETFHMMDYCIASMHVPCVTPGTKEENTNAAIKAMHNPYVKILGHPDDARVPLDYKKLVEAALLCQTFIPQTNAYVPAYSSRERPRFALEFAESLFAESQSDSRRGCSVDRGFRYFGSK